MQGTREASRAKELRQRTAGHRYVTGSKSGNLLYAWTLRLGNHVQPSASHHASLVSVDARTSINAGEPFLLALGAEPSSVSEARRVRYVHPTMNHHQRDTNETSLGDPRSFAQMLPSLTRALLPDSDMEIGEGGRTGGPRDAVPTNSQVFAPLQVSLICAVHHVRITIPVVFGLHYLTTDGARCTDCGCRLSRLSRLGVRICGARCAVRSYLKQSARMS